MKVFPINFTDDIEKWIRQHGGETAVGIEEMSITYCQPADTNSMSDEVQHLTFTTRSACAVGIDDVETNNGFYLDMTIPEGEHWSVESGDELKLLVEDFFSRLNYKYKKDNEQRIEDKC